ncbi:aquaporin-8-like isoform X2 [Saccostrea cucullata]|uniref:aquaporin-8-like isoform X2 n=1 Tax=Saccostrea cuccullata TaxID=36930 RepID=UPI002ED020A2
MADEAQTIRRHESDRALCGGSVVDNYIRPTLAEFLGTAFLVFLLCLCAPIHLYYGDLFENSLSALVYGFGYVSLIYAFGDISGGYFNPAITFALAWNDTLPVLVAVFFIIAQTVGGILGGALALAAVPTNKYTQFIDGATKLINETDPGWALLVEVILTFMITFTVLLTAFDKKKKNMSPLAIGFSVVACAMSGVLFSKRRTPDFMNFTHSEGHSTPSNNIPIQ